MLRTTTTTLGACLVAAAGMAAERAEGGTVSPTKAGGDFIAGSGIPADNFVTASAAGVTVALKARGRDSGQPLGIFGSTYAVAPGKAASNPNASWWSFDFQFTPSASDTVGGTNYLLTLEFDTDPTAAGQSFVTLSAPLFDADADPTNSWDDGDGFFVNPGGGAWSDDAIDYVYSQSWRPDFSFLAGKTLGPGFYDIRFSVAVPGGPTATAALTARVVPLPTAAGLGAVGLALLGAARRRRGAAAC